MLNWNPADGPCRQGDVMLIPSRDPEPGRSDRPTAKLLLASGSTSAHAHYLDAIEVRAAVGNRPRQIFVPSPSILRVEPESSAWRHPAIAVPAGVYDVEVHHEFTPAAPVQVGD